jgi:gluconolactonase
MYHGKLKAIIFDKYLYVADNNKAGGTRKLWRFRLRPDGAIEPCSRKLVFHW